MIFETKVAEGKIIASPGSTANAKLQLEKMGFMNQNYKWRIADCGALLSYRVATRTISIQLLGTNATSSTWSPVIQTAAAGWNSTDAGTNITLTTDTSSFVCEVDAHKCFVAFT